MNEANEARKPLVSIIMPCYMEAGHIRQSVAEIERVMRASAYPFELIFVDDAGPDDTAEIIRRLVEEDGTRIAVFHEANRGRGAAVMSGIAAANGEIVGFIDLDLEVHARYIVDAVSHIDDLGYDMVVGRRDYRIHLNLKDIVRHIVSVTYRRVCRFYLPIPVSDTEAGFKFFRKDRIVPILAAMRHERWFWDTEIVLAATVARLNIGEIDCLFVRRRDKKSTVRLFRDTLDYLRALREAKEQWMDNIDEGEFNELERYWTEKGGAFSGYYRTSRFSPRYLVKAFLERRSRLLASYAPPTGEKLLDIGCGGGENLLLLADRYRSLRGIDISTDMIATARSNLEHIARDKEIRLEVMDWTRLAEDPVSYDVILMVGVLDYLDPSTEPLALLRTLVKMGGSVIITLPKSPSPFALLRVGPGRWLRKAIFGLPPIATTATREQLYAWSEKAGFIVRECEAIWDAMWVVRLEPTDDTRPKTIPPEKAL